MIRKKRGVKFTDKRKSVQARISIALSCFSAVWLIYGIAYAYQYGDRSGNRLGAFGMLAMILQVVSLVRAYRSTKEEDVFPGTPRLAVGLALLLLLLWLLVYGLGWYLFISVR